MHFKITETNIRIDLTDDEIEPTVVAAVEILISQVTKKVYFLRKHERNYPRLTHLSQLRDDFRMIDTDQTDRTYLRHFRIVESDDCVYIAPNTRKLDRRLWDTLCEKIRNRLQGEDRKRAQSVFLDP